MPETASAGAYNDSISSLKEIPDTRMSQSVRIQACYLLLVEVLGIQSKCDSLCYLKRLARCHHAVLIEKLGIKLKRPPSDSAFRDFFLQVDVASICVAILK